MKTRIKTLILASLLASSTIACAATSPAQETPAYLKGGNAADEAATPAATPKSVPRETKEQRDARMAWWREARFGMFIHWGVYARLGGMYEGKEIPSLGEQIMGKAQIPIARYKELAKEFNPTQYDAEQWVLLAKRAGMKYIIITAKHVDGFALWPSAANDWNVGATLYKKDLLKPLADACKKHGIKLGFYYAQTVDWSNGGACNNWDPAGKDDMVNYMNKIAIPQINELATNYGDAPAILWWDVPVGMNYDYATRILDTLKVRPELIQNNRLYKMSGHMGVVDMASLESIKGDPYYGDTETPEQYIPATGLGDRDFEVCMTMNDTWGYKSFDHNWKSTKVLLQQLIDIASKGGNYLLNVGPTGEGLIPQASVERLEEIGKWMDANGESIYGTQASPFAKLVWGRCTTKKREDGTTLYLHVFNWPEDGKLLVPGLESEVKSARLLVGGTELKFEKNANGVVVDLPAEASDANASVIKMEIAGESKVAKVFIKPEGEGSIVLPAALVDFGIPKNGHAARFLEAAKGTEIGYWESPEAFLSWDFTGAKPGDYEVLAEISGIENAKASLELSGKKLPVNLAATGNYSIYQIQNLGKIRISGRGEQTLAIRPDQNAWKAFNLRKITLRPIGGE